MYEPLEKGRCHDHRDKIDRYPTRLHIRSGEPKHHEGCGPIVLALFQVFSQALAERIIS